MMKRLFANLLDQMILFACSVLLLLLTQLILKVSGYKVNAPEMFILIFYFIVNLLYLPIAESGKNGTSLGKRIIGLSK